MEMKRRLFVGLILGLFLISGCNFNQAASTDSAESDEDFIENMIEVAQEKYTDSLIYDVAISRGSEGRWDGRVNLVDYEAMTFVIVRFPKGNKKLVEDVNPWDQSSEDLAEEIGEYQEIYQNEGLTAAKLPATKVYKEEIEAILALNHLDVESHPDIDIGYGLAEDGIEVQCSFSLTVDNEQHAFVLKFNDQQLEYVVCPTLELMPMDGVDVHSKSNETAS